MTPVKLPKFGADESRLRVLLVEDSATDAMVIGGHLRRAAAGRAEVLHAETLARALELARSNDIHLTLLDLNLPDSRGLATLERMRGASRGPKGRGYAAPPHMARAMRASPVKSFSMVSPLHSRGPWHRGGGVGSRARYRLRALVSSGVGMRPPRGASWMAGTRRAGRGGRPRAERMGG